MTTQALICWLNMNKDKVPASLHSAITELSVSSREELPTRPLTETLVEKIASQLCHKSNEFGVPYFQGYKEHAVELVKRIDSEIRTVHSRR